MENLFLLMFGHKDDIFYKTLYGKYIIPEDEQSRLQDIDNKRLGAGSWRDQIRDFIIYSICFDKTT